MLLTGHVRDVLPMPLECSVLLNDIIVIVQVLPYKHLLGYNEWLSGVGAIDFMALRFQFLTKHHVAAMHPYAREHAHPCSVPHPHPDPPTLVFHPAA